MPIPVTTTRLIPASPASAAIGRRNNQGCRG
jgi:hypothetical protein